MVQPFRRNIRKTIRELECSRVAHLERRYKIQARGGLADRLYDPWLSMSGVDAPKTRHSVEDTPTICGYVMHTFRPDEHHWVRPKLPHRREWKPMRIANIIGERT
jgi:hypothetical protein